MSDKRRLRAKFLLTMGFFFVVGLGQAQAAIVLNFDEYGNGRISQNGGAFTTLQGTLMADPTQAGNPTVLTYLLPESVISGDIRVWDDSSRTILSDVLRFTDAAGTLNGNATGAGSRMIYYSDAGDGATADLRGIPATLFPTDGGAGPIEVGTEDVFNTFTWAPGGNVYNGISDTSPEPSSLVLASLGAGCGLLMLKRRRRGTV
jgi:hypothetical protein